MRSDLDAVIIEVAEALSAVPDFADPERRHTGANVGRVTPPAVIVEPSGTQTLDGTYGPAGMDLYSLDVTAIVAQLLPGSTWAGLAPFIRQSGPSSVKAAIEGHEYASCSYVTVGSYEIVVVTFAGNQYLGVTFSAESGG
jgi:hypothetical protein